MKKIYTLVAGRKWRFIKQSLSDESLTSNLTVNCEVRLSEDLGLVRGDLVKVTIEKIEKKNHKKIGGINSDTSPTEPSKKDETSEVGCGAESSSSCEHVEQEKVSTANFSKQSVPLNLEKSPVSKEVKNAT